MDRVMTYIKQLQKEILLIPDKCAERAIERLNTEGVMYKPFKGKSFDEFDDVGEGVQRENGKYKSKYFPEVESTGTLHVRTDEKKEGSFTCMKGTSVPVDGTGAPATTPGKGEPNDPFIILDNGKPSSSSSSIPTKEFPSVSRTPQNVLYPVSLRVVCRHQSPKKLLKVCEQYATKLRLVAVRRMKVSASEILQNIFSPPTTRPLLGNVLKKVGLLHHIQF